MNQQDEVVIVAAKRTPLGSFLGTLKAASAVDLGACAVQALMQSQPLQPDEIIMGCVLSAGLGQAPARQVALAAGLNSRVAATTVNKVCGSGIKAMMMAHDSIMAGSIDTAVAGGMESMSNAPYMLDNARGGCKMGHQTLVDHMMRDGLEDAYQQLAMGTLAQATADKYQLTRQQMDEFAAQSIVRAQQGQAQGHFVDEIAAVNIKQRRQSLTINSDEGPSQCSADSLAKLRPVFSQQGTITAANASSIADGAAAVLLTRASVARQLDADPLCRIVAQATHAQDPADFTLAPVGAMEALLHRCQWQTQDVDLWEINEAFAMVPMLAINQLGLDSSKVNVNGGACVLGHPLAASGTRIVVSLIHALRQRGLKKGVASLCIGGGEAVAIAIEMV
ncbi:thiolase family protein [Shewanella waksmanii]|uniref:thiolase family protein n=1 Tax=Shewanella waksmanii TaxID=213783 RepID=UPI00048B7164|nr:thiolase family protein [Shewanella waksmanii]